MKKLILEKSLLILIIIILLLPARNSFGYKNVYALKYERFTLGMSVRKAIKNLKKKGYAEIKGSVEPRGLQYKIATKLKDEIPTTQINGRRFDNSIFVIFFINNEMVTYHLEKDYQTNIEPLKIRNEYTDHFGKPDAYRNLESPDKTRGSFEMIWGGEPEGEYFEPRFPHVKVKCSYVSHQNSLIIKERLTMMDLYKIMAIKYSSSLKHYIRNIKALKKELKKKR